MNGCDVKFLDKKMTVQCLKSELQTQRRRQDPDSELYPEFYTCLSGMTVVFLFVRKVRGQLKDTETVISLCRSQLKPRYFGTRQ